MKRFFNIFLTFSIIACIMLLSACSNDKDNDNAEFENPEYYLALGYHYITFDNYSTIIYDNTNNDKTIVANNKIMLPHNSKFSISFNLSSNTNFVSSNSNFINFETGKILSGFTDGTTNYNIYQNEIILKDNITLSATFENFKTAGVAIVSMIDSETQKPDLSKSFNNMPNLDDLLYYYSKDSSFESFASDNNKINSNTGYITTITSLENNKFELNIYLETYLETTKVYAYLILIDDNNCYYFFEKEFGDDFMNEILTFDNISNANCNIHKINLSLSYDLSTRDEY